MEIWRTIKGYNGRYVISNSGEIKRVKSLRLDRAKLGKLRKNHDKDGYRKIQLHKEGKAKSFFIHRLVLQTFVGNPKKGQQSNHKNGIKSDNRVCNLEWCSRKENVEHAHRTGLCDRAIGSRHHKAKLKDWEVLSIRKEYSRKDHVTLKYLSNKYGVTFSTISRIIRRVIWKSI
jgi:hypothetical protein